MKVTDAGIPVEDLIDTVKHAVKRAGVSPSSRRGGLRVESAQLVLHALASNAAGGGLDFRIPFIGMKVRAGAKITSRDTHTIDITFEPPGRPARTVRSGDIENALVDAIVTINGAMNHANEGDDPWILSAGTIDISFGVTRAGFISVGADGELADEVAHTLRVRLVPAQPSPESAAT